MARKTRANRRTISAALTLLGVIFYASLLSNHLVSEFRQMLAAADSGSFSDDICHAGQSHSSKPVKDAPSCPFCKGLAAFQLAVTATAPIVRPIEVSGQRIRESESTLLAIRFIINARSRGPPPARTAIA
ncbi:hypothetical protein HYPDE_26108 [Hyphomicrobium denitrificans 1NES1]|uniref:DUF2946 domain-containing protein n=1 Tax=Hyphomicrobium denitrificans 1NES1 TaxID=670307 RepID=N0B0D2_9HYPH|nr:DUF2946 family protein [Hyphomicrobium denitrificans]AGK56904.1 hypothetical protein HYPDE_26108 [Hyphomicrobium denitrificans 1NES1]